MEERSGGGGGIRQATVLLCKYCIISLCLYSGYWYFSYNQVITVFLSDLHLLLWRKHLQLAPTKEHNRCCIYNPLPPQQNTETFTSCPADSSVSLAGVYLTALGCAAGSRQLSYTRTSAWTLILSLLSLWFGVVFGTAFPPDFLLTMN